jgi:hypothetical protein
MGSDKTEVWNVKLQRGLGISPEANKKALSTHARSGCIYLGQLFFPYLLYLGRVGYSNMALLPPLSCMHLTIYFLGLDVRPHRD